MEWIEFKAWLSGFEEAINGRPTKEQWKKIKAKMALVDPDYPSHWWGGWHRAPFRIWYEGPFWTITSASDSLVSNSDGLTSVSGTVLMSDIHAPSTLTTFDTYEEALVEVGRMDAASA